MNPELLELTLLRSQAEWSMLMKRADTPRWVEAWRQRQRWDARWNTEMRKRIDKADAAIDLRPLIKEARRGWGAGVFRKKRRPENYPSSAEVAAALEAQQKEDEFVKGAMAIYLSLGSMEGEESGQHTLNSLGIHKTFTWAGQRDFPANTLAVRGSKILQTYYGNHREKLAKMVIEKCDPSHPKTMGQLTKEIRQEWGKLSAFEARRIARTESAFVWETTNWNAMLLNDVQQVEWLIASGPSIGPPKSQPVCEECLAKAASSPWVIDDMEEIPPVHPHCRCTIIQKYDPTWLPPAEPWTGAERKLEVFT